jgi:cytidine deaminase
VSAQTEQLVMAATTARGKAYVPYSGFRVGAAILAGGRIFAGANIEIASYPISVCAERNAIAAMIMGGERRIDEVVVVTASGEPTSPCGACRQALWEFGSETDPIVTSVTMGGRRVSNRLKELLPIAFGPTSFRPQPGE